MAELPLISGRQARKGFESAGWNFDRQRGSHMIMTKAGVDANLSIPDHRELDRGTLRHLIRLAGMSVEDFVKGL